MNAYQNALDYIYGPALQYPRAYGAMPRDLSRMERLLERLGNPHHRFRCVHIAGTKGKGSTAAITESVLRHAGYRTGLFTSPHLHTFRERIRLNGQLIPVPHLVELLERCKPALEAEPERTTFETITALAFVYFAENEVDWAILEVGLGGRLDATNVVRSAVCVITSLSYDHMEILGHTLSLIAWEKAGIIKPGVPVISAPQPDEAMRVIVDVCRTAGARLETTGPMSSSAGESPYKWQWDHQKDLELAGQAFTVYGPDGVIYPNLFVPLLGRHQLDNACVAVAALHELQELGMTIAEEALYEGMRRTRWPGRLEVLGHRPWIVVDCAHNADSAQKLCLALHQWFPYQRLGLIFGASADKDIQGMLEVILPLASRCIVSASFHPRAADPHRLIDLAHLIRPELELSVIDTIAQGLDEMLAWAGPEDLILVTGSIFVVAAARLALAERRCPYLLPDDWVYEADPLPDLIRYKT
ncbi:MAG: folylpolyglutamate synthase/dihydrofolate synthase family protein [Anaerolineae bacterium]|nr:bifunctional folylpolyglutamate synthase/dihydrofolate synthase [Anaerolineae bacterium]MDW8098464.1 folylpolyglutamate synthase/dihydrofolate synthase family protein [Anaerolineae bacterium]